MSLFIKYGSLSHQKTIYLMMICFAFLLLLSPDVFASGTGEGLPWEAPLDKLKRSLSGPVAMSISLVALVACGSSLIFGNDMNDFSRRMVLVILAITVLVSGTKLLEIFFGTSGALIS